MTRVVDGVSRGAGDARPEQAPVAQPVIRVIKSAQAPVREPIAPLRPRRAGSRLPQGRLDGVRPMVRSAGPIAPRVAPAGSPAPTPMVAAPIVAPKPAILPTPMAAPAPRRLPLRAVLSEWVSTGAWRRPAMAMSMVLIAFVASGVVVRSLTAARSTARAEQVAATATPAPTVSPTPTATPAPTPSVQLQQIVDTFVAQNPGAWGIVVKNLRTGEVVTHDSARSMTSASLYKLFVAQRVYQNIDLGKYTYEQAAGKTGRTVRECLNLMITVSDNPCGQALIGMLGYGTQDQALAVEGYHGTSLANLQRTSADDVAFMLERIYNGTLATADSNARFLALLKAQKVNNRLPMGLPKGTVIAHKTGDLYGYIHDAGIVYGPKSDYLVVVMSGPWNKPGTAAPKFAKLSSSLWNYFEN